MNSEFPGRGPISAYSLSDEIESICEQFDAQWIAGGASDIEAWLDQIARPHRAQLLAELIKSDMAQRAKRGQQPSLEEYLDRFASDRDQIRSLLLQPEDTRTVHLARVAPGDADGFAGGHRLGHYELIETIGRGGFGTVWKARDTRLKRTVAIKIPHARYARLAGVGSVMREGQAAARLNHVNIVTVHTVEQQAGEFWIVSDFVDGPDLKQWLREHRCDFSERATICAKLAEGLHHAHTLGVVHRDLKPANVLLEGQEPRITDFGLAKNLAADETISTDDSVMGTPAYMSPEQASGRSSAVDCRADVFSLGVMLYEMLTGGPPFTGEPAAVLNAILHEQPDAPRRTSRDIPRDLETICLKAIEKEPARRYQTAQEMAVDLRRFLRGESILARPPGRMERAWRWAKKHPGGAAAAGLALSVLIALGVVFYLLAALDDARGWRDVAITTEPAGARLAFAPLNKANGEPRDDAVIFAKGLTPTTIRLPPSDYFVVAVLGDLDDERMRFHEVFRRVPEKGELGRGGTISHLAWTELGEGLIELPPIVLPDSAIDHGMGLFQATDGAVRGILLDPHEFTVADYRQLRNAEPRYAFPVEGSPSDQALSVSFDNAMQLAEEAGKRLPFDGEFVCAANLQIDSAATVPENHDPSVFGAVQGADVEFDCVRTPRGSVWGLRSNVAEWTASRMLIGNSPLQIVRGGDSEVINGANELPRDPNAVSFVMPQSTSPGLGLRLARSARPRYFNP